MHSHTNSFSYMKTFLFLSLPCCFFFLFIVWMPDLNLVLCFMQQLYLWLTLLYFLLSFSFSLLILGSKIWDFDFSNVGKYICWWIWSCSSWWLWYLLLSSPQCQYLFICKYCLNCLVLDSILELGAYFFFLNRKSLLLCQEIPVEDSLMFQDSCIHFFFSFLFSSFYLLISIYLEKQLKECWIMLWNCCPLHKKNNNCFRRIIIRIFFSFKKKKNCINKKSQRTSSLLNSNSLYYYLWNEKNTKT